MFSYQIIIQDICAFVKYKYAKCLNFSYKCWFYSTMFFISREIVPSGFCRNSTEFSSRKRSAGIFTSMPLGVFTDCFSKRFMVFDCT